MLTPNPKLAILSTVFSLAVLGGETDEKKLIDGTWSITYAFLDGKQAPADELKKGEVVISAGKLIFRAKGKTDKNDRNVWKFQVDPSKKPKTFDVRLTKHELRPGGDAVETFDARFLGIYELKAGELKIAFSKGVPVEKTADEQEEADKKVKRPTSFEHGPDVAGFLILKRVEK
jgi:uncharacterized protein (TIGR03067 family)